MVLLQALQNTGTDKLVLIGSVGMVVLAVVIIAFVSMHQRKVTRYHKEMQRLEQDKQQAYLKASVRFQEEERQRIAADLHDDAGPLLATVRLYLNDNLVNQEKAQQLQSIFSAKQIIDDAIQLIRNISHSLMPPTLKNFGLESAVTDLFQKINGSGVIKASARFHDYRVRLKTEQEMLAFRVVQELVNNIIKHSNAGFIHLTENVNSNNLYIRIHHDGQGIIQSEYDKLSHLGTGLGLKNIASRMKVLGGKILFELDASHTYYKITLEVPREQVI
jgi:two-component system NarL family sensor kinase